MSDLLFGYCDAVITPVESMGLAGYAFRDDHSFGNSGVLDDLYVRALSLKSGDVSLIIITLDICLINDKTGDIIRECVSKKIGIPVENIMVSLSHTHSGPMTYFGNNNYDNDIKMKIQAYMDVLISKIIAVSSQAISMKFKCKLYSTTFTSYMGYNRRCCLKNGDDTNIKMLFTLWQNPSYKPNGTVDPDIPVLMIERINEKVYDPYLSQAGIDRIIIFNVPAHPVVLGQYNRYVSADYPGAAIRCIEETLGIGTKSMFMLGACGNVNALLACQNNPQAVEVVGKAIGYGICAALSLRKEIEFDGLKIISENIKAKEGAVTERIVTQIFKLGKAAIIAVSCECFTELGISIRMASPFDQTLVSTNSNGGYGYIPTKEVFEGATGYEGNNANKMGFTVDLIDKIINVVKKNMKILNL